MPKPKASYPWDYFDEIEVNRVRCRICSIEFNKKTSNQQNHLKRHHQISRPGGGSGNGDDTLSLSNVSQSNISQNLSQNSSFVYNLLYEMQKKNGAILGSANQAQVVSSGHKGKKRPLTEVDAGQENIIHHDGSAHIDMENDENNYNEDVEEEDGAKYFNHDTTNTSTENSASAYTTEDNLEMNGTDVLSLSNEQHVTSNGMMMDVDFEQSEILKKIYHFNGNLTREMLNFWGYDETDKIIDLHSRKIKSIDVNTFKEFSQLVELNLSKNQIKNLEPCTFEGCGNLKILDLSQNQLRNLKEGLFKELTNLDTLLLDNNMVDYILKDTFQGLDNLKKLSMNKNLIQFINVKAFKHMVNLELGANGEFTRVEDNPCSKFRLEDGVVFFS